MLNGFGITASAIAPGQLVRTVAQLDEPCAAAPVSGPAESLLLLDGVDGPALQALLAALRAPLDAGDPPGGQRGVLL